MNVHRLSLIKTPEVVVACYRLVVVNSKEFLRFSCHVCVCSHCYTTAAGVPYKKNKLKSENKQKNNQIRGSLSQKMILSLHLLQHNPQFIHETVRFITETSADQQSALGRRFGKHLPVFVVPEQRSVGRSIYTSG